MNVIIDSRFNQLIDAHAPVEQIASGFRFTEGPVWSKRENCLYFSDPRTHIIHRWSEDDGVSNYRESSNSANGNTFDPQGRLITCESRRSLPRRPDGTFEPDDGDPARGGRCVSRTNLDGSIEGLATHYKGMRLSGPNDIVCLASGDIIFTDPNFALRHSDGSITPPDTPFNGVYRIRSADGAVELVTSVIESPNGLVVTDDGRLLVADTRHRVVRSFPLNCDPSDPGEVFVEIRHGEQSGGPDGMKLDALGNLYVAANSAEGIWVFAPDRTLLGYVPIPERPANCTWGDESWQSLYVTAQTSVYRVRFKQPGQQLNPDLAA